MPTASEMLNSSRIGQSTSTVQPSPGKLDQESIIIQEKTTTTTTTTTNNLVNRTITLTSPIKLASTSKITAPVESPKVDKGKGKEVIRLEAAKDGSEFLRRRLAGPSDQKAGLTTRDPEEVSRIIYEVSKGSKYFENEKKKDEVLTKKVDKLLENLNDLVKARKGDLTMEESMVDEMIRDLESTRITNEVVAVFDADAFFASCAQREDPTLVGTAFAVGQGVLTTASYEARKYGCRSAQAGFVALKLCPHLKFVKLDFALYTKASKEIFTILATYGEMVAGSLDEAYCSLTKYCEKENVTPTVAAERIRDQVKRETGLTVSAGVSCNTLLSKIGADQNKPDGQFVVEPTAEAAMEFMARLPIRKVPGIGRVSERWLRGLGVNTVGDIYDQRGKLYLVRKEIGLTGLLRAYLGLGSTTISQPSRGDRKGVGQEETFSPTSDMKVIDDRLRKIADDLAQSMARNQYSGRTINLKIKFDTYEATTRALTMNHYFSDATWLYREGRKLLDKEIQLRHQAFDSGKPVKGSGGKRDMKLRLIGLRMSNLKDEKKNGKKEGLDSWRLVKETKVEKRKHSKSMATGLEDEDFAQVDHNEDSETDSQDENEEEEEEEGEDEAEKAAGDGVAKRQCPICNREIVSSLLALNQHVVEHLDAQSKPKLSASAGSSAGIKRKPSIGSSSDTKKQKVNPLAGFFTKSKKVEVRKKK